jgi:hypothetical protein
VVAIRQLDNKKIDLAVRVGIATGPMVVSDLLGQGAAQEAAITGETPNSRVDFRVSQGQTPSSFLTPPIVSRAECSNAPTSASTALKGFALEKRARSATSF